VNGCFPKVGGFFSDIVGKFKIKWKIFYLPKNRKAMINQINLLSDFIIKKYYELKQLNYTHKLGKIKRFSKDWFLLNAIAVPNNY
jgi:hypothetical protein